MSEHSPGDTEPPAIPYAERVRIWDAAFAAARATLRGRGLREVTTPVRVRAPALEPWIEPIAAPPGWLATSPELSMKRLLCRKSGPIFQISHCFRHGERGCLHREEFHLAEWYRVEMGLSAVEDDVEALVSAVFEAVGELGWAHRSAPSAWRRYGMLDLVEATLGVNLRGDEDPRELREALRARPDIASAVPEDPSMNDRDAAAVFAWTAFFTAWCDAALDPWLDNVPSDVGVHVEDFPVSLAALARCGAASHSDRSQVGFRFESHVHGRELANGYDELRDPVEQRRRFEAVAALRESLAMPALPMDEAFLAELDELGLPRCSGVALGLDRLVMLATGVEAIDAITLHLGEA